MRILIKRVSMYGARRRKTKKKFFGGLTSGDHCVRVLAIRGAAIGGGRKEESVVQAGCEEMGRMRVADERAEISSAEEGEGGWTAGRGGWRARAES